MEKKSRVQCVIKLGGVGLRSRVYVILFTFGIYGVGEVGVLVLFT